MYGAFWRPANSFWLLVLSTHVGVTLHCHTTRGETPPASERVEAFSPGFVAVGYRLRRVVSSDGKTWRNDQQVEVPQGESEKAYLLRGVAQGDGVIVAVGSHILTSRDGSRWKEIRPERQWLGDVVYGGGMFVAVGYQRSLHSRNGRDWSPPVRNNTVSGRRIAYGDGRFTAIGWMTEQEAQVGYTTTSTNAKAWTNTKTAGGLVPRDIAFGGGRFVLVGTHGLRESSVDGVTWEHRAVGEASEELRNVIWTGSQFIAIGPRVGYMSPDGIMWKAWSPRVPSRIAFGGGLFIGCSRGQFSFSTDGRVWTPSAADGDAQILDIEFVP
ncbi:MAG: hypothetical protein RIC55_36085 [Pirellulaceae bacterium]